MDCELESLATAKGRGYDRWCAWSAERGLTISGSQHWRQMCVDRASATDIRNHHSFLHRPGIFAVDEPLDSAVAVVFTDQMRIIHRLALSE